MKGSASRSGRSGDSFSARSGGPAQRRNMAFKRPRRAVARPGADACLPQRGTRLNSLTAEHDLIELFGTFVRTGPAKYRSAIEGCSR